MTISRVGQYCYSVKREDDDDTFSQKRACAYFRQIDSRDENIDGMKRHL